MCKHDSDGAGTLAPMENKKETRWYDKALVIAAAKHGWSKADLVRGIARATGSSDRAAYSWLTGDREPTLDVIRRIAKECLGVSIGELIEDDPYFVMDEKERELIDGFRGLNKEQQDLFRKLIAAQAKKPE